MRKIIQYRNTAWFCVALAMLAPSIASAQSSFTGPYIGASVGIGWNGLDTTKTDIAPVCPPGTFLVNGVCIGEGSSLRGIAGTAFVGYNHAVAPRLLAGIEADFTGLRFAGTFHGDDYDSNWSATLRGRLGYEVAKGVLVYATGGAGWINVAVRPAALPRTANTLAGYVAGAGLEWAAFEHVTVRLEYLYGKYRTWEFDPSPTVHEKVAPALQQLRVGVVIPLWHH